MRLKQIASALALLTISGCSLFPQEAREVEIITKPVKIDIVQPTLPRPVELKEPRWYVVSDKKIANEDRTYLDKFIEDIKKWCETNTEYQDNKENYGHSVASELARPNNMLEDWAKLFLSAFMKKSGQFGGASMSSKPIAVTLRKERSMMMPWNNTDSISISKNLCTANLIS